MPASRVMRRSLALGLLLGAILLLGLGGLNAIDSYAEGQNEIAEKGGQLRGLRDLTDARAAFARLLPKGGKTSAILPTDANAQEILTGAVGHAADGQDVIIDGIEALPAETATATATATATVHLRGTQAGLYAFLRSVEDQIPYLLVPRFEMTTYRAADPEHNKPLVLSADLRIAALIAPAPTPKAAPAAAEPSP